jgi:hypothetical protein
MMLAKIAKNAAFKVTVGIVHALLILGTSAVARINFDDIKITGEDTPDRFGAFSYEATLHGKAVIPVTQAFHGRVGVIVSIGQSQAMNGDSRVTPFLPFSGGAKVYNLNIFDGKLYSGDDP